METISYTLPPEQDGATVRHILRAQLHFSSHGVSRLAHAPDGITVNAILPGRIDTEMLAYATPERRAQWLQSTPLGRFGDTADIAELAVFLASDKGGYITGAKINVNGGLSTG